jgi:hypothetical protein
MSVDANKAAARRFVEEVLDGGRFELLEELFVPGAVRHFPPGDVIFDPAQAGPMIPRRSMKTDIHHLCGEGDYVTIYLTHHVEFSPGSRFTSRLGPVDVGDKPVQWDAMVVLRFEGDMIAEEWVVRDELHVLMQAGAVKPIAGAK